jgi:hypothetical protein
MVTILRWSSVIPQAASTADTSRPLPIDNGDGNAIRNSENSVAELIGFRYISGNCNLS